MNNDFFFFSFNDDSAPTLFFLLGVWADFKCKLYGARGSVCKAKASKAMYLQTSSFKGNAFI